MKKYLALLWHTPQGYRGDTTQSDGGYVNWDSWREWYPDFAGTPCAQGTIRRFIPDFSYGSLHEMNQQECQGSFYTTEEMRASHVQEWGTMVGLLLFSIEHYNVSVEELEKGGVSRLEELYNQALALRNHNPSDDQSRGFSSRQPLRNNSLAYGDAVTRGANEHLEKLKANDKEAVKIWGCINTISYRTHSEKYRPRVVDTIPLDEPCHVTAENIFFNRDQSLVGGIDTSTWKGQRVDHEYFIEIKPTDE